MKQVLGLLMGATMMASIPVMADELVLSDHELDTVTAGDTATAYTYTYTNVNGKEYVNESYSKNGPKNGHVNYGGKAPSYGGKTPALAKNPAVSVQAGGKQGASVQISFH